MKCIGCGKTGFDCINEYCLDCAAQRIREYDLLKKNLESAIEPVRSWYGDVERSVALVVVDVVADLQKSRAALFEVCEEINKARKGVFGFMIKAGETLEEGMQRNYTEFDNCRKKLREELDKLEAELKPPSWSVCEAFVKKLKAFLVVGDAMDQTEGLESHPLVKPLQEACSVIEKLSKAELRRVAELHTVYTEKSDLNAVLQRALKDVAVFEDLANKAETARVVRLETCLREIAKSPNWRGVPNWVVLKIQEVVGC